jgi:hypothetical protein
MLYEYELTRALEQALPGTWTQVGETRNVTYWRRDSSVPQPINTEPWRELATSEAPPLPTVLSVGVGWYRPEGKPGHRWSWCRGTGHVRIQTEKREPATATLRLAIRSRDPMTVTIAHAGRTVWQGAVGTDRQPIEFTFPVRDGLAELDFTTDRPPAGTRPGPDPRVLAFAIYDPHVALSYTDR